jgi:hypothetical protein
MRVSIDRDTHNPIDIMWCMIKGIYLCRRLPFKIRKTRRGYHLIWKGLPIPEYKMYAYRKVIGDDKNRIFLDRLSTHRLKQVLFSEKKITYY